MTEPNNIVGEIYLITCIQTNKQYIGQTMSHRLNHGKYRPFGYKARFKNHLSEAKTNPDKNCYLKNAIRKYGADNFNVELVTRCSKEELDTQEKNYIIKYNTLYPNGYNLTTGGKACRFIRAYVSDLGTVEYNFTKTRRDHQTEETRQKISTALKTITTSSAGIQRLTSNAQDQHMKNRIKKFEDCVLNENENLENFIRWKKNKENVQVVVEVPNKNKLYTTTFYGKYDNFDNIKKRAIDFLKMLKQQRHDQIAGTPLEL